MWSGVSGASGGGGGVSVGASGGHDRNDHHHGELSLRPSAAHNMSLKPKTPALLPQSALSSNVSSARVWHHTLQT